MVCTVPAHSAYYLVAFLNHVYKPYQTNANLIAGQKAAIQYLRGHLPMKCNVTEMVPRPVMIEEEPLVEEGTPIEMHFEDPTNNETILNEHN